MKSIIGFIFLLMMGCQKSPVKNPNPQNYTCPLVMQNFFVVVDKDGKNRITSGSASTLQLSVKLISDTTKAPPYGGYADQIELAPGAHTFSLNVNETNYGSVSYNLTSLGNYYVEGKGCFVMNSITFNGNPVMYDTTVGVMVPTYPSQSTKAVWLLSSGSSAPVLVFQL